ncbi:MAG: histidine kinase dimerization/phosphoacceptor domain -containing protein, partial [Candidatus Anammoxibacter sp.]
EPFGYLIKPFEPRVLRTTIESALYKHCMEKRLKKYQNNLEKKVAERTQELSEANTKLKTEIAERKLAEEHIRKLHRVVEQSPSVVMITDMDGNIEYVNPKFTEITGYSSEEIIGKNPRILKSGREIPEDYKLIWDMITLGKEWSGDLCIRKKDGGHYWESASILPLRNPEGIITNYIKVAEDITERKFTENELIKSQCELEERVAERTEDLSELNKLLQSEITERKRIEEQIKESLKEKEVLLREIHHRVKNNMQIIISLLRLKARKLQNQECVDIFTDCENRIRSMALIHEQLYKSGNLSKINLDAYIRNIIDELQMSYGISKRKIKLNINVSDISLGIDTAIPCGLVVNELISNSFKYAFPEGKEGQITISIISPIGDAIEMIISDNGIGIPENIDFKHTKTLGLELVNGLVVNQLRGTIELNRNRGTEFRIGFKEMA